jgi:hypothetical protein
VPGLDGHQPAEPTAEHEHGPDPQHTTGGKENNAEPANRVTVERPGPLSICVGRQIALQQPKERKGDENPAVGTILALAGTQISAAEERDP